MKNEQLIVISGAGLVGSMLAAYLAKRGYNVRVYEKRTDPRSRTGGAGRSINLALSNRGLLALDGIDMRENVEELVIPMAGRMIHGLNGDLDFQPYGKEGQAINSVSRKKLNEWLISRAEKLGVQFKFSHACLEADFEGNKATFLDEITRKNETVDADLFVGADGAFSAIRQEMQKTDRFNYEQYYIAHGYKELTIPADENGDFKMESGALHIWPRQNFMLIALPNPDGSFTCTLFLSFEGKESFAKLNSPDAVKQFFEEQFSDAYSLIPDLEADFFENPTSSLVTIRCYPWVKNRFVLIGDAAHAIVPFYGQGMNAGFEDCYHFNLLVEQYDGDWDIILAKFQEDRKSNGDAIADLALQNFIEMRDKVIDPDFVWTKKIEALLHEKFPQEWIPLYSMVTFSDIPYADALKLGKRQAKFMKEITNRHPHGSDINAIDLTAVIQSWKEQAL